MTVLFKGRCPGFPDEMWLVRHSGENAATIKEMFGTDTLPTPYVATTDVDIVLTELRRRYPQIQVDPTAARPSIAH